jgi:hypothetical protein
MNAELTAIIDEAVQELDMEEARSLLTRVCAEAVETFYAAVNGRAEADMLAGNPLTGAHCRALQAEIAAYRKDYQVRRG